jgi:arylsulfatase A-like enzyme
MAHNISRRDFMAHTQALAAAGLASSLLPANAAAETPNIIIIFADDLGYGDLSCYGHPVIRTPNLDALARDGMRLTSFYTAAPSCTPSRAGLLTGRYPQRCGLPRVLGPQDSVGLPDSEITLAQLLKKKNYQTMAIGKWHLGHAEKRFLPTAKGFDGYFGLLYSNDMQPPWVQTDKPLQLYRDTAPVEHPVQQDTLTERYTQEAVRFIRNNSQQPFFLYLAHTMPHLPLHVSEKFRGRSRGGLYGDVIEAIDWSVGEICKTLAEKNLTDKTLILFTSDNGPWCNMPDRMLHEGIEKWDAGTPGLLHGAKGTTWEGGQRVPFIAKWPNHIPAGLSSCDMASTLDLLPTLAAVCDIELPHDRVLDGANLYPFLQGLAESPRQEFYYLNNMQLDGVRSGKWKLRIAPPEGHTASLCELYDLETDPAEKYNVADRHSDLVQNLTAKMRAMAQELKVKTNLK